ncbi:MAG: carboxyl transferase [Clostridium sp.]|nr:carboxyl transferase [Clostridium sp.]MCM1548119.1 carboxyl transferase [Ruminococcus sp.]
MQIENNQARERLSLLFDDGVYSEINSKVKEMNARAVITAYGYVNGNAVYAFSQDSSVNKGAVDIAHSEKIAKIYELAAKTGAPVIGIHDSCGAFVDGNASALSAYGKMMKASAVISGVVPQISVILGTCTGSAAMIACASDFVIMTKESEFFMAPNSSAGSAEAAAKSGIASILCEDDKTAIEKTRELVNILPVNNLSPAPMFEADGNTEGSAADTSDMKAMIAAVSDAGSSIEICAECGGNSYTGFASVGGMAVGIASAGIKGEKIESGDCSKLARFIRTCDAFSIPVVTFVNSDGFADADTVSAIKSMSTLADSYAEATTVKIAVVRKAVGPLFIAVAGNNSNSDFTYAYEESVISPMSSEAAVEFMWHDRLKNTEDLEASRRELAAEYEKTFAGAEMAAEKNLIDEIIGASDTRNTLISALDILSGKRVQKLPKKHNNIQF